MDRSHTRPPLPPDADRILQELTERQFVRPHRAVADTVGDLARRLGVCDVVVARAIAWLELDPDAAIGRLRRTELAQLARSMNRFGRQVLQAGTAAAAGQQSG